jgi:hypothetical protein
MLSVLLFWHNQITVLQILMIQSSFKVAYAKCQPSVSFIENVTYARSEYAAVVGRNVSSRLHMTTEML